MLRFEEFQNSIEGYERVQSNSKGNAYDVYGEIISGVRFSCTIRESEIDDRYDIEGQLQMKAYELFIKAIE